MEASIQRNRVVELWSLFTMVCGNPSNLTVTFPGMAQSLGMAMNDIKYPQLVLIICHGLTYIVEGVTHRKNRFHESDKKGRNHALEGEEARILS